MGQTQTELDGNAIREVERLTREAVKTAVLDVRGVEPPGVYYLVGPDGNAERKVADPGRHAESLDTPAELLRFIRDHQKPESATYLTDQGAVFVYDQGDRRDRANCGLTLSPQYQTLASAAGKAMGQQQFVRLLRIDLRGCLPTDGLLNLIRNLKFDVANGAAVQIEHSRQSIGKSIVAQVAGADAIPEEVVLRVPVFENHPFQAQVACAIEVLVHEQAFRLNPYPMELRRAMDAALADVGELLSHGVEGQPEMPPVYLGKP